MISWAAREHHRFEAAGRPFVYLVPSAAIFALDDTADAVMRRLTERPYTREELRSGAGRAARPRRSSRTRSPSCARAGDRRADRAGRDDAPPPKIFPLTPFPLTTMVLNVTNQCNLSLHLLLRVRRGQDRRHRERQEAEVHERGDRAPERGVHAQGVGRQQGRAHHVLRRRDAAQLPGAEADDRLRAPARRRAGQGRRLQPHDQRARCSSRRSSSSSPRTRSASRSRSTARARCRTSSASSTTAPAATTSSRRRSRSCSSGIAAGRSARASR